MRIDTSKIILAIDPGNIDSGFVVFDNTNRKSPNILDKGKLPNNEILDIIRINKYNANICVLEMTASYGMPTNQNVLDTTATIGIFKVWAELHNIPVELIFRKTVKLYICGSVRGVKDSNISAAMRDRYGEDDTKKRPNEFYKTDRPTWMNGDIWAALAVAVTYAEFRNDSLYNDSEETKLSEFLRLPLPKLK